MKGKMEQNESDERITNENLTRLKDQGMTNPAPVAQVPGKMKLPPEELAKYIDHTLLKPESVIRQFTLLCDEAIKYKFNAVCVNSGWVPFVTKKLRGSGIKICSVIGFPLGGMESRSKASEAKNAIEGGADELDMVINIGALKSGELKWVEEDIRAVRNVCRTTTVLKVIIETFLLTEEEKVLACEISKKAEADFVKTSTGFLGGGATVEDIVLMRKVVGPNMGVKASGLVRDYNKAIALISAGANRLGCGSSVAIIKSAIEIENY